MNLVDCGNTDIYNSQLTIKIKSKKMIVNPEWHKPKEKPYFHQISLDCIEKLVECMEDIDIEEMDCDTCLKMQEILREEIDDEEFLNFAIENYSEMFGYINTGRVNIRIHRDIEGKMWFGVVNN